MKLQAHKSSPPAHEVICHQLEGMLGSPDLNPTPQQTDLLKFVVNQSLAGNADRIDTLRDFFDKETPGIDAVVEIAEAGTAWPLLYPKYSIVVPKPHIRKTPVGYAVARRNRELVEK